MSIKSLFFLIFASTCFNSFAPQEGQNEFPLYKVAPASISCVTSLALLALPYIENFENRCLGEDIIKSYFFASAVLLGYHLCNINKFGDFLHLMLLTAVTSASFFINQECSNFNEVLLQYQDSSYYLTGFNFVLHLSLLTYEIFGSYLNSQTIRPLTPANNFVQAALEEDLKGV
jgi:hypothetical protein